MAFQKNRLATAIADTCYMRKLKFARKEHVFFLENIPDKYKFIEKISQQFAKNKSDLEAYYQAGVNAFEDCRGNYTEKKFEKFQFWGVRQAIIKTMQERNRLIRKEK